MQVLTLLSILASLSFATPAPPFTASESIDPWLEKRQSALPAYEAHMIDVPIDHFPDNPRYEPHDNETFKQRYFFDASYYKPGGPVFLYIGGETSGESRFSNLQTGIIQILMEKFNGLGVILENRYYGESFPFETSTTDELRFSTTEQTIADNAYFAQHAAFPGLNTTCKLTAPSTPWIMYGGSLAGAQTAFTMKIYNSLFAGGIGSSATVQAILGYWQWYEPILKFGPSDCISRIINIVQKIDTLIESGNEQAIQKLKEVFGLGDLADVRDFAMTIAFPIGGPMFYPTNTWQELNWSPRYGSEDFYRFCGNVTDMDAAEEVKSVDYALAKYTDGEKWEGLGGYASYVKKNQTYWADVSNGADRSYLYSTCSEQGAYQVAPPPGYPSLISHVLQINYTQQWCEWAFPPGNHNALPPTPKLSEYNKYGGWNIQAARLALIDGNADVWLDLCYHSDLKNKTEIEISSDEYPSYLIAGGGHHWDSFGIRNVSAEPNYIREAHLWEIRTVRRWVEGWGK